MIDYAKYIKNALSLRDPQTEALRVFQKICDTISMEKSPCLETELDAIHQLYPTLTSFERDFPSFTFALATGIGKTRLMGAMIAYLHYTKGVCNFFVMAPNLTIYNKLKDDFGKPSHPKYVFKGLDKFVTPPRIIDGDNYANFRDIQTQQSMYGNSTITINIFNISKLTSDSKAATKGADKGKPARIKRLNEVLGTSYFEYLKDLEDLCVFMDESHHYHADKSFEVINELKPLLGVEVTATPQWQKGAKAIPFQNVVYEYSLAHALNDERYVKIPVVVTRKDFKSDQYLPDELDKEKLSDGIKLHKDTQNTLALYALSHSKKPVRPFVLVVAKDTDHAKQIQEYLTSNDFYRGTYKNKVLEIHSAQKGAEKEENIEKLLQLESPDNEIEIVIHVNMLKEGWDVTNLYTIIPLRASASETLTEQTIGRGLRLPYGDRTGVEGVDRLSIVSHDKYADIIKLANDENSLLRKVYTIGEDLDLDDEPKTSVPLQSTFEEEVTSNTYTEQLALLLPHAETQIPEETKLDMAKTIAKITATAVQEVNRRVKNIEEVKSAPIQELIVKSVITEMKTIYSDLNVQAEDIQDCVQKAVEFSTQTLTDKVIPIPVGTVQARSDIKIVYDKFTLDTSGIHYEPSDEMLIGTELQKDGKTFDIDVAYAGIMPTDTPENAIAKFIIAKDNIDYSKAAEVIYDVIDQLKAHLRSYLPNDESVNRVLRERRKNLAETLYQQINRNFRKEGTTYTTSDMRPFSKIEIGYADKFESDKIFNYMEYVAPADIKKKIYTGFNKACHAMYKFESTPEKTFSAVLENDSAVLRWMRPSVKQFNLYYDKYSSATYQPDFIVETVDTIYMVEIKDHSKLEDSKVLAKAKTGAQYCVSASVFNAENGGKPWAYKLIPDHEVRLNSSLKGVLCTDVYGYQQEKFDV